jgi:hypothetical protein
MFVTPLFIFFASALMIPRRIGEREVDLGKHFIRTRRPVLWSFVAVLLVQFVDGSLLSDQPWWFSGRIPQLAVLSAIVAGTFTVNNRFHTAVSSFLFDSGFRRD